MELSTVSARTTYLERDINTCPSLWSTKSHHLSMTDTSNPSALSLSSLSKDFPISAPQFLPWTPGDPIPPYIYITFSIDTQAEADNSL